MNPNIVEKISQIERIDYFEYLFDAGNMFQDIVNLSKEYEDSEAEKMAVAEIKVLNLNVYHPIINKNYTSRFDETLVSNKRFSDKEIKYFEHRLTESSNVVLKSRYSDFIYEYGQGVCSLNKFQIGSQLVNLMLQTANMHFINANPINGLDDLARAFYVSLQLKNKTMIGHCNELLFEFLTNLEESNLRWVLESAKISRNVVLSPLSESFGSAKQQVVLEKLELARSYYWETQEHHLHRSVCKELIEWSKVNKSDQSEYITVIGASFEAEAEHQQGREHKSELVKASFLERALQHYMDFGFSEHFDDLKIRIRTAYELAIANGEFKLISSSGYISQEAIEVAIQPFLQLSLENAIMHFGSEIMFIPNIDRVETNTKDQMHSFSFSNLARKSVVSDGKKIFQAIDDNDSYKMNFNQNYMREIQTVGNIIMLPLIEKLIEKGLNATHVMNSLRSWGNINKESESLIKIGIEKFFENDYVSSMHILVPQLEALVRNFFGRIGYATTVIKKGTVQQEQTFNEFLERKDIKSSMPKKIHKYLSFLLVEKTGCNFRNRIAHGLIHPAECNMTNNIRILHLYLLMTNFTLEEEK
ncbi:DUF4209 domain-containing protein [Oceanobacillus rekensis]|uniref:DUF4209 domain-containing protein n=1 Tax=Oceanobacillus rekensis TaxID=937927 RepID=UPI000B438430|nr:DUF4209 domain-containing protein [Oceanobacillus rekensis]